MYVNLKSLFDREKKGILAYTSVKARY